MEGFSGGHCHPHGFSVLVIDNDPIGLKVIEAMLARHGYIVTVCNTSEEALSTLKDQNGKIDFVIAEVHMDLSNKFGLISCIKLDWGLPVFSICSDNDLKIMYEALSHGSSFHFIKPLTAANLETMWQLVWKKKLKGNGKRKALSKKRKPETTDDEHVEHEEDDHGEARRARMLWDQDLHQRFLIAVQMLGEDVIPSRILDMMNVEGLNVRQVSSHLQKHRKRVEKAKRLNGNGDAGPPATMPTNNSSIFPRRLATTTTQIFRRPNFTVVADIMRAKEPPSSSSVAPQLDQNITPRTDQMKLLRESVNKDSMQMLLYGRMQPSQSFQRASGNICHQPSSSGVGPLQMHSSACQANNQDGYFGINSPQQIRASGNVHHQPSSTGIGPFQMESSTCQADNQDGYFVFNNPQHIPNWGMNLQPFMGYNNSRSHIPLPNNAPPMQPAYQPSAGCSSNQGHHHLQKDPNQMQLEEDIYNADESLEAFIGMKKPEGKKQS